MPQGQPPRQGGTELRSAGERHDASAAIVASTVGRALAVAGMRARGGPRVALLLPQAQTHHPTRAQQQGSLERSQPMDRTTATVACAVLRTQRRLRARTPQRASRSVHHDRTPDRGQCCGAGVPAHGGHPLRSAAVRERLALSVRCAQPLLPRSTQDFISAAAHGLAWHAPGPHPSGDAAWRTQPVCSISAPAMPFEVREG